MDAIVFVGLSLALLVAVTALVHQMRLRRALQALLRRLLNTGGYTNMTRVSLGLLIMLSTVLAIVSLGGCGKDERLAQFAREAADRQAAQNREMSRLNREVAQGTKRLVEADAQSRTELVALQQDLRADQTEVNHGRDRLEAERKEIAAQRNRDPVVANAIDGVGLIVACLVPLLFCWFLFRRVRAESD